MLSLDYLYLKKAFCLPTSSALTPAQHSVIQRMAEPIDRFIARADRMSTCSTSSAKLKSKKLNYCGEVIEHMEDIVAEKVIKAWPTPGNAAVVDPKTCLPDDLAAELDDLHSFLLPRVDLPNRPPLISCKLIKDGYERGFFCSVDDKDVPTDKRSVASPLQMECGG